MRADLFDLHAEIETTHWWFRGRRDIASALLRRVVPREPRPLVIDVGCGTGANAAAFAEHFDAIGIDVTEGAVALARKRFPGLRFMHGAAPEGLSAECERAAAIAVMDVLEHVPDDFLLLSRLLAALRPGAHVLITVPAHMKLWSEHDVSFGHYRRYDLERLTATWSGMPVTVRLVSYFNSRLYPAVRLVRAMSQLRGHAAGRAGTDLSRPPAAVNATLRRIFAGEAHRLVRAIDAPPGEGYGTGVSLVALLRREEGQVVIRKRPAGVAPDAHDPRQVA